MTSSSDGCLAPYRQRFHQQAKKEWDKLPHVIRIQLAKKLKECLQHPRVESAKLSSMPDCYKVKLRASGFRAVYQVQDGELVVMVIAVGKRERSKAYGRSADRLSH